MTLANKKGKVAKTKLEAWCKENGYPMPDYEAYGRMVCAYFWKAPDGWTRERCERHLRSVGCKVNTGWTNQEGFTGTEVTNISYFKAWHWDE